MDKDSIKKFQTMINESNNIVFIGGAGTSTECGIPDFRGANGLYSESNRHKYKWSPEIMLSHKFYVEHPKEFFDFYRNNMIFDEYEPNSFHFKLAKLEETGKLKAVITQNIDGMHQKGGSKNVIEVHGTSNYNFCRRCDKVYDSKYMKATTNIPRCDCGGIIRPKVTLYGEALDSKALNKAYDSIKEADMLIVAGTSLTVYPVAELPSYFEGKYFVIINNTETPADNSADLIIRDNIVEVFEYITI